MKLLAVKLCFTLFYFSFSSAYNPYITSLSVKGCKLLELGSDVGVDFTNKIDVFDLVNNKPVGGGLFRTRVCFKGTSDLLVMVTDTKAKPKTTIVAKIAQSNTKSFFELNGKQCGALVEHGPLLSTSFYTCAYVTLTIHPNGTLGTVFVNIGGLEPTQIACSSVTNPGTLRYISFGTSIADVTSATVFYDCPMTLVHNCFGNQDLNISVNLQQNQTAAAKG